MARRVNRVAPASAEHVQANCADTAPGVPQARADAGSGTPEPGFATGQTTASGEGWELTRGDCLALMADLPDDSVDVVITDPPYSAHTHEKQWVGAALTGQGAKRVKTSHTGLGFESITPEQAAECASEWRRLARRWVLVFTDLEGIALWQSALSVAGLDYVRTCIWDKVDGAPQFTGDRPAAGAEAIVVAHRPGEKRWNGGGRRNVFRAEVNGQKGDKPHPTTKPQPLMRDLVALFSDPGELILDAFTGSGSTGVAAVHLGRRFHGFELAACAKCKEPAAWHCSWLDSKRRPQSAYLCEMHRVEVSTEPDYREIRENYFDIACRRLRGDEAKPRREQPSLFDLLPGVGA